MNFAEYLKGLLDKIFSPGGVKREKSPQATPAQYSQSVKQAGVAQTPSTSTQRPPIPPPPVEVPLSQELAPSIPLSPSQTQLSQLGSTFEGLSPDDIQALIEIANSLGPSQHPADTLNQLMTVNALLELAKTYQGNLNPTVENLIK